MRGGELCLDLGNCFGRERRAAVTTHDAVRSDQCVSHTHHLYIIRVAVAKRIFTCKRRAYCTRTPSAHARLLTGGKVPLHASTAHLIVRLMGQQLTLFVGGVRAAL